MQALPSSPLRRIVRPTTQLRQRQVCINPSSRQTADAVLRTTSNAVLRTTLNTARILVSRVMSDNQYDVQSLHDAFSF